MRKSLLFIFFLFLSQILPAQWIHSVDINVYIDDKGDAYVKQLWDVSVVSGTEWYIPIGNLNGSSVRGLTVSEDGREFEDEGRAWNTQRSLEEKAFKSGIIDKGKDGVELCWGQGSYGPHKWTAGFVVLGLVQSLNDYDAFNFMFVNPGLVAPPQHASITFERLSGEPFSADSTRFWFFGCEGESVLRDDGTIFFETDRPMPSDGKLIAMMRFEKGMFAAHNVRDMSFEKMQKEAFKGSSYKNQKGGFLSKFSIDDLIDMFFQLLMILVALGTGLVFLLLLFKDMVLKAVGKQWSPKFFGATSVKGWSREAPFGGSIPIAAYLLKEGSRLTFKNGHPERAIGAFFLRWIRQGYVTPVPAGDGHYDLQFQPEEPDFDSGCEKSLYKKAFKACGDNRILEKGEFDSWAKKNYKSLAGWPDSVVSEGRSKYGSFKGNKVEEGAKLLQFKNFLNDFTISSERNVPEVGLWGQYLEFAQFFGIADKVAKAFAKLYPTEFDDFSKLYGLDSATMSTVLNNWSTMTSRAYRSAYSEKLSQEASSRSGSSGGFGGHSSFGGGGGFSGGGFGGGSR